MIRLIALVALQAGLAAALQQNPLAEPDPFPKKEFDQRLAEYMKIRKKAAESVPPLKAKAEPEAIAAHKPALAAAIRAARPDAVQGTIFTPPVRDAIIRIVKSEVRGKAGASAKGTIKQGNPTTEAPSKPVVLKVNASYTEDAPLSSVPPTLLLRLPELPKDLSFRFVGGNLILVDGGAGIIVDFIQSVTTAEVRAPVNPDSLRFAVIGDTGTGSKQAIQVAEQVAKARQTFPFELVVMLGDNMYGGESARDYEKKFEKPYRALLDANVKFYASLGNHDEPNQRFYDKFNMGGKRFYTFQPRKGVRFFALDSNYMDREQIEWLQKEMAGSGSEWKIAFFHHPLYSSGDRHGPSLNLRAILEPIFIEHGVSLVLTGHEHFYERIKPQRGIYYFIAGSSAKLRSGDIGKSDLTAKGFDRDQAFTLMEIDGEQLHFRTITRTGAIVDSGTLPRLQSGK